MHESGRYLYVLFCCQQAVEKTLKALIVHRSHQFPPRLHNLSRLAQEAGLPDNHAFADDLRELSAYYIQSRYPEEIGEIASGVTSEISAEALGKTEKILTWLNSMMTS